MADTPVSRDSLPPAARRWLDRCLPDDAPIPERISFTQRGEMYLKDRWKPFTATQSFEIPRLGFAWNARIRMAPLVWIDVYDGIDDGVGRGRARFWGFLKVVDAAGPEVVAAQVVRYLAELPWIPQAALANPGLEWEGPGSDTFAVTDRSTGAAHTAVFTVADSGDVVRMTGRRMRDAEGGYEEGDYRGEFGAHAEVGGVRVPTSGEAIWDDMPDGPMSYWRGTITGLA